MISIARHGTRLTGWFQRPNTPEPGTIALTHRRVYIVPTRMGWTFAVTLGILLLGSINYALSLGFALTFLLAGMGLAGMVHTARNIARIAINAGRTTPAFAGESAVFSLHLENFSDHDRAAVLVLHIASYSQQVLDLPAHGVAQAILQVPAGRRGWLPLGRVTIETRFPLGLFRAWSNIRPDVRCLIYPQPEFSPLPSATADAAAGAAPAQAPGSEDFSGLRAYQPSDSPRHVAWKAVARGTEMLTKQFSGDSAAELWLDWGQLPRILDSERKLSRLAGWVLAAEQLGARYGLRLPGIEIALGHGDEHCADCLRTLALYES
ncbi:MAG: DUF58 domain-containing protein [Betaproteobacteria bacterium]|nr:DUF58 domain-containing protein [Betaproteobacteria bacterium]